MTEFDPVKALREEIHGLSDIRSVLLAQERRAEEDIGIAEAKRNAMCKLRAFADAELAIKREKLDRLMEEK